MNKEFMLLNDNTIEVTNEEGKEINRGEFESNNVERILLSENKIEIVDKLEKKLQKENIENKKVVFLSNSMLKFQVVLIFLAPLLGFTYGAISHPSDYLAYGIYESIYALIGTGISISITTIYYSVIKPIYIRKVNKINKILTQTETLKKKYEEELQEEKQKNVTKLVEPLVKVSLEEKTNIIENQIEETLRNYSKENLKQSGKVKIRKR